MDFATLTAVSPGSIGVHGNVPHIQGVNMSQDAQVSPIECPGKNCCMMDPEQRLRFFGMPKLSAIKVGMQNCGSPLPPAKQKTRHRCRVSDMQIG